MVGVAFAYQQRENPGSTMLKNCTERATKVLRLAGEAAQESAHRTIQTEHVLLGLLREGTGVAVKVMELLGADLRGLRASLVELMKRGVVTSAPAELPPIADVITAALRESAKLNHMHIGTEHLLLSLFQHYDRPAAQVLARAGISYADVRNEVIDIFGEEVYREVPRALNVRPIEE